MIELGKEIGKFVKLISVLCEKIIYQVVGLNVECDWIVEYVKCVVSFIDMVIKLVQGEKVEKGKFVIQVIDIQWCLGKFGVDVQGLFWCDYEVL